MPLDLIPFWHEGIIEDAKDSVEVHCVHGLERPRGIYRETPERVLLSLRNHRRDSR